MPKYLCHGFRWKRGSIRLLVILNDLDDGRPDWLVHPESGAAMLALLHKKFNFIPSSTAVRGQQKAPPPDDADHDDALSRCCWSAVKLLEEWDERDESSECSKLYAYLADFAVRLDDDDDGGGGSGGVVVDLEGCKERYKNDVGDGAWFMRLRDELQAGTDIEWYTVVCDDEERSI